MSMPDGEGLVAAYLKRLEVAAGSLPAQRRSELVAEIRSHIADARARGEASDEAGLRNVLERLGQPEDIAASAAEDAACEVPGKGRARTGLLHEYAALGCIVLGSFLVPVVGWLAGVLLLWTSARWTTREKLLGTLVIPGGPGAVWLATALPTQSCSESAGSTPSGQVVTSRTCSGFALPPALGVPLLVVALVASFAVPAFLLARARRTAGDVEAHAVAA